jgi:hypothetical protein
MLRVKTPVRGSAGSRASFRIRMPVSSLCITSARAAWRIKLVIRRPETQCRSRGYSPLGGCWQRDPGIPLQALQSFKRHTTAITELRDHRHRCRVILLRAYLHRFIRH